MMVTDWLDRYPTLYPGILRRRNKRFLAEIELAVRFVWCKPQVT